jgi:hypothetical protein
LGGLTFSTWAACFCDHPGGTLANGTESWWNQYGKWSDTMNATGERDGSPKLATFILLLCFEQWLYLTRPNETNRRLLVEVEVASPPPPSPLPPLTPLTNLARRPSLAPSNIFYSCTHTSMATRQVAQGVIITVVFRSRLNRELWFSSERRTRFQGWPLIWHAWLSARPISPSTTRRPTDGVLMLVGCLFRALRRQIPFYPVGRNVR